MGIILDNIISINIKIIRVINIFRQERMIEKIDLQTENFLIKSKLGLGIPKSKGFNNLISIFDCSITEYNDTDSPYSVDYFYEIYEDSYSSTCENYPSDGDIELLSGDDSNKNVNINEDNKFSETLFINFMRDTYLNPCENTSISQEKYINHNIKVINEMLRYKTFLFKNLVTFIHLPPSKFDFTICLDLDETLIHTDFEMKFDRHDYVYDGRIGVNFRPGLKNFLEFVSRNFEVVLFTSALEEYANKALEIIDPKHTIFSYKLYRQHCSPIGSFSTTKDLRTIANRDIDSIFLVDNEILNMVNQMDNGYLIPSFYNDTSDRELFKLQKFLEDSVNIKASLKEKFRFSERLEVLHKLN